MTIENRSIAELSDILSIQFECQNEECQSRLVTNPDKPHAAPFECPRCGRPWALEGSLDHHAIQALLNGIKTIREGKSKTVRIRLEFPVME